MAHLVSCPSCSTHILADETACPFCEARQPQLTKAVGVVAMGLFLAGCPESSPDYGVAETEGFPTTSTTMATDAEDTGESSSSGEATGSDTGSSGEDTDSGTSSGTSSGGATDTDPGSTSISPDYGVPTSG